ncbi:hypothetical protein TPHA_0O01410 [Tetrapisispora phaffii CBS 4417]|uniref:DNA mismatch repair protein HSM3 n=1 Tax=Tetrapisispora phaffii (strain ATCC 24235 / CBS 4417 / NBRC 1672 / NRRL Y-8282 / UCD 70-5) TaxID=1071381 RepID=G8C1T0_TETPH|nr:hypothetical protein TPHA_0O01410 [Tetrapisispora phaffii CBS 4417]CCE66108.1 hypothetical protein TPHA_0O01410 [Tetrapisispora phaffii CBS 4417]
MTEASETNTVVNIINETYIALETNPLPTNINSLLEKCLTNIRYLSSSPVNLDPLLRSIKALLLDKEEYLFLDDQLMIEVMDHILKIAPFDLVLNVFTMKDIESALISNNTSLIKSALKVIELSSPKSIFASSPLFDLVLKLYFYEETDLDIINKIENLFRSLSSDELVANKILVNNKPVLLSIKKGAALINYSRMLELLSIFVVHINQATFDEELFIITPEEIASLVDKDILFFIQIINYYSKLLDDLLIDDFTRESKDWIYQYLEPIFNVLGQYYKKRDEYVEIKLFTLSYLFQIFRKVSYWNYENCFNLLDKHYLELNYQNEHIIDFLSFVNPKYLYEYHSEIIKEYADIKPSRLSILRNLVSNEKSFNLIKDNFTAEDILKMPYMEQMVLLERMSQYKYCVKYILHTMPTILGNLVNFNGLHIIETETVELREQTIDNLIHFDVDLLGTWYAPLVDELNKIKYHGIVKEVQPKVESMYL